MSRHGGTNSEMSRTGGTLASERDGRDSNSEMNMNGGDSASEISRNGGILLEMSMYGSDSTNEQGWREFYM